MCPQTPVLPYGMIPETIKDLVFKQSKGDYQEILLIGRVRWSGSDLKGAARNRWGASYAESRDALTERIRDALKKRGWTAHVPLVLVDGHWTRRLVLVGPRGGCFLW